MMDSFQPTIDRLRKDFVRDDVLSRRPEIIAIFLSGSRLYKEEDDHRDNNQPPQDTLSDWDGFIFVNTKYDIYTLVNDHRQDLMDLIGIEKEECLRTEFQVPSPSSPVWPDFDAVRFAGFGKSSEKRGVKILSWEYFMQNRTSLNILSYKDVRAHRIVRPGPSGLVPFWRIHQASTLPDQLVILHDQWVFMAPQIADGDPVQAAFGVTADLILSGAFYQQFEEGLVSQPDRGDQTPFAASSQTYKVIVGENSENPTEIFCKESPYAEDEIRGAMLASAFYPRVQLPRMSSSGVLLYPLFQGSTESEIRLSYIKGGRSDTSAAEKLLYIELVKAEDTLRGYRKSLAHPEEIGAGPDYKVQRFYHPRLIDDVRLRDFYGPSVQLMGNAIPRDEFLGMQWVINGTRYPSLRELFDAAYEILKPGGPQISSCPVLFGHGDAHGGNIMISAEPSRHSSHDVLIIDFEVSGYHPVMLDLAKPLYMDTFFESLYLDLTSSDGGRDVKWEVSGNTVIVDFASEVDWLSQAIFDIKKRYLIRPLCDELLISNQPLDDHVPLLSSALFLCATFSRNFAKDERAMLLNFAIGIILAGAENWVDLYLRFEQLGFRTSN
ncbi:hypothetical protein Hte_004545 [Hypoxylon texense]